ncbi:Threonine--tRNA ligase [Candidatus Gugararchaeum adminiculabundum]|nr:Threonine--tRNA ligase [Candidatus Gugararchaeum adminiculabundum]
MKILCLDCNSFSFQLDHPTPVAEKVDSQSGSYADALVAFIAIEPGDSKKTDDCARVLKELKEKSGNSNLLLNPFAHLSSELAKPKEAIEVLDSLCKKVPCKRASFGWYKSFTVSVKGHANSQIFRSV